VTVTQQPPIDYAVIRSRRKTADIILERDGSIVVRAPEWVNDDQISRIVAAKQAWIYARLAERRDLEATRVVRELKNGEGFLYLGRSYRLRLVDQPSEPLMLKNGRFLLRRDLVTSGSARAAFRAFYTAKGRERLPERVALHAPKVGVSLAAVEVRDLGHRWATCRPDGRLAFHWKCMLAPLRIIDYIVVHELCHRHHRNHSAAFWNEVDKVMPDYRERKEWLRKNGAGLEI